MPIPIPTLADLQQTVKDNINSGLDGADATIPRSKLWALAQVEAGSLHVLYGIVEFISRQVMADTAEAEYLERIAAIYGMSARPAVGSSNDILLTGTDATTVPIGTLWTRRDGSVEFESTEAAVISGGVATVAVQATSGGLATNAGAGTILVLVSPVAGLDDDATVDTAGLSGGVDVETTEDLRDRLLFRIRNRPRGGAEADYIMWAMSVSGVTKAWIDAGARGAGTLDIYFTVQDTGSGVIPTGGQVTAVDAVIQANRPVTADAQTIAPTEVPIAFTIALTEVTDYDLATAKANVESELGSLFLRSGDGAGTVYVSDYWAAIMNAEGVLSANMTAPAANSTGSADEVRTLGTVTWV